MHVPMMVANPCCREVHVIQTLFMAGTCVAYGKGSHRKQLLRTYTYMYVGTTVSLYMYLENGPGTNETTVLLAIIFSQ